MVTDKEYLEHFLLSHPYFLDSVELLTKLLDRYASLMRHPAPIFVPL